MRSPPFRRGLRRPTRARGVYPPGDRSAQPRCATPLRTFLWTSPVAGRRRSSNNCRRGRTPLLHDHVAVGRRGPSRSTDGTSRPSGRRRSNGCVQGHVANAGDGVLPPPELRAVAQFDRLGRDHEHDIARLGRPRSRWRARWRRSRRPRPCSLAARSGRPPLPPSSAGPAPNRRAARPTADWRLGIRGDS